MEEKKESPYKGYKPQKGVTPPWNPFDPAKRKKRITINERKFLGVLAKTGSLSKAYRAAYTVKAHDDKRLEAARVSAMANQVLTRLRKKAPELVEASTFEDITPEFVKKELMNLYKSDQAAINDKIRVIELMGKLHGMYTDKKVVQNQIKEVADTIYQESEEDFPEKDERIDRLEFEKKYGPEVGEA